MILDPDAFKHHITSVITARDGPRNVSEDIMSDIQTKETGLDEGTEPTSAKRRAALAKLGLGVGIAYMAPTVLRIDRSAHAMGPSCVKNPKFCT